MAGWVLGAGGNDWSKFLLLCLGASLLYTGGMFLNDAFDADFDRQYRKERPIPSGAISERDVWIWGFLLLIAGAASVAWFGRTNAILTALLMSCIVGYDAIHKRTIFSPLLMAACRFFLYLLAASSVNGLNGFVIWSALVLAAYIAGLSYIAKTESAPGPLRFWPCVLLAAPLVLAYLANDYGYRKESFIFSGSLLLWTLWSLRKIFVAKERNIGAAVSGLLAGIVLVDLLATLGGNAEMTVLFLAFFITARLFQKFIPAT